MLQNFRIAIRLNLLVGIFLAFLAATSFVGYLGLSQMHTQLRTVYEENTVPLVTLAEALDQLGDVREKLAVLAGSSNASERSEAGRVIRDRLKGVEAQWIKYKSGANKGREKGLADAVEKAKARYFDTVNRIVSFVEKGDMASAASLEGSAGDIEFAAINDAFDELKQFQADEAKESADSASASFKNGTYLDVGVFVAALLIGGGLALAIVKSITGPLRDIIAVMQELERGNLTVSVPGTNRADELGEVAQAVSVFKTGLAENERLKQRQAEQAAQAEMERKIALRKMADDFESAVGSIVKGVAAAATQLQASAETLADTARTTTSQSSTVAAASEELSVNVQTVAAATEEMSASVSEIARQLTKAQELTGSAVGEADRTNHQMGQLSEAAESIVAIISMITEIAEQTKLLALNATIEAARAGEHGKGFAVVASEVKALATQTAKATDDISAQITAMKTQTEQSVAAIGNVSQLIRSIDDVSTTIGAAVEEQSSTTHEISRNVQQAALGAGEVSQQMGHITDGASTTTAEVDQLLSAARELSLQSEHLNVEVGRFLDTVRA